DRRRSALTPPPRRRRRSHLRRGQAWQHNRPCRTLARPASPPRPAPSTRPTAREVSGIKALRADRKYTPHSSFVFGICTEIRANCQIAQVLENSELTRLGGMKFPSRSAWISAGVRDRF